MPTRRMDEIEKLLKTGRPAPQPEHNFQIISEGSEPKLVDVKQLERDAKEYQKSKESLVMSDMNIYEPVTVTDYKVLASKFGGDIIKLGNGGTTFDPIAAFTKLPDDEKDKLAAEAIKFIEKRKDMK